LTDQCAENFVNRNEDFNLDWLSLYWVTTDLPVKPNRPEDLPLTTSLWRGYVGTWVLHPDGRLQLTRFEYPNDAFPRRFDEVKDGFVTGDFSMVMRPWFRGPTSHVPFVDGRLVDRSKWLIEDRFTAHVYRTVEKGLVCGDRMMSFCFIPCSWMHEELKNDPAAAVGQSLECKILSRVGERKSDFLIMPLVEWERRKRASRS